VSEPSRSDAPVTSPFLDACRGLPTDYTPVWFMRQAGRALPEYRAARGSGSIVDAVRSPDLAAELTLQPVRRYGVDAAILFSDIVIPLAAIGFGVDVHPGIGPVVEMPFKGAEDLDRLRPFDPAADTPYVLETVKILRRELRVPLIGFAGAPFTLASYLIEGGPSRDFLKTKTLMYGNPPLWTALVDRLADITLASLRAQVAAGVQAVQLFDSWVGALGPADYRRFAFDASSKVLHGLSDLGVPTIHFGVGTGELLSAMAAAGASVVGVDWRVPLDVARRRVGPEITVQGNLDPAVVLAGWDVTKARTVEILELGGGHRHVFNLGHGVLPGTDPDLLTRVVDLCHTRAVRP
jgi:uroporphyrinogen decarboxylase